MWPKAPELALADGRVIRLVEWFRTNVYHGLLEGAPHRRMNLEAIQRLRHWERGNLGWATQGRAPALLPTRIWVQERHAWEPQDWYGFEDLPEEATLEMRRIRPEWMPDVGTVALFISDPIESDPRDGDASYLSAIWFQRGFNELIEEQPLEELRKIPWNAMASSWIF